MGNHKAPCPPSSPLTASPGDTSYTHATGQQQAARFDAGSRIPLKPATERPSTPVLVRPAPGHSRAIALRVVDRKKVRPYNPWNPHQLVNSNYLEKGVDHEVPPRSPSYSGSEKTDLLVEAIGFSLQTETLAGAP